MDNQITSLAGEFFVAAELFKRGHQVAVTMGNAKAVDLMVQVANTDRVLTVEVKTLRSPNCFGLHSKALVKDRIYVFVTLNDIGKPPSFAIVPGLELMKRKPHFFGSSLGRSDQRETVNRGPLKEWEDRWDLFQ